MASSIQGVVSTVLAALAGFAIGQAFNGTQIPYLWGLAICGATGLVLVLLTDRRRLFERLAPAHDRAPSGPAPQAG
jgi:DHA1 family bicyclomycin/chloramphenicol resistance-like MFS transporter